MRAIQLVSVLDVHNWYHIIKFKDNLWIAGWRS